jgi:hypothetical protein
MKIMCGSSLESRIQFLSSVFSCMATVCDVSRMVSGLSSFIGDHTPQSNRDWSYRDSKRVISVVKRSLLDIACVTWTMVSSFLAYTSVFSKTKVHIMVDIHQCR